MTELSVVGKNVVRVDARTKVLGKDEYCSDKNQFYTGGAGYKEEFQDDRTLSRWKKCYQG